MVRELGPWQTDAACLGDRSVDFFPSPSDHHEAERSKAICRGCDVREQCLAYALETRQMFGIWGGLDERERRALVERARRAVDDSTRRQATP